MTESLIETYGRFMAAKQSGFRKEAREIADGIIERYKEFPDPTFIYDVCERCDHKIDFLLWKALVLPELRKDLTDNSKAIRAMIQTIQNLYSSAQDWKSLEYTTEEQLTLRLLALTPNDQWAKRRRVKQLQGWLSYTIHEWPSGVLYGSDGATVGQCDEILEAIEELRGMDDECLSSDLCNEVRTKTLQYRNRVETNEVNKTTRWDYK